MMHTVSEMKAYTAKAEKILTLAERDEIITMIARDPAAGDIVQGTGGIRKIRFGIGRKGKNSGARIIYYYHSGLMPILLLTVFAKNEKANLTKEECNQLGQMVKNIKRAI